jgi:hypothetical protein
MAYGREVGRTWWGWGGSASHNVICRWDGVREGPEPGITRIECDTASCLRGSSLCHSCTPWKFWWGWWGLHHLMVGRQGLYHCHASKLCWATVCRASHYLEEMHLLLNSGCRDQGQHCAKAVATGLV